ncbi:MAG: tryptophan synthase subunit alpha [Gammaproteobacteria bacterium]|nr:tryptophan synthase subunit alpha [Gammaproteobacteria bacterium]
MSGIGVETRLTRKFAQIASDSRGGLITFLTAGDPTPSISRDLLSRLPAAGADIIELGMPFSDPMADGPAIQAASQRALKSGATLKGTLGMVRDFRQEDSQTPIILMGYFNPIYQYGSQKFVNDAYSSGVDGLIIVDLPPEEDEELCHPALTAGLHWIRLVTPTTDHKRLISVLQNTSGFVYYVSITGITGTRSADPETVKKAITQLREMTDLPLAVGFGIKSSEQVYTINEFADAAVVGSALVDTIRANLDDSGQPTAELCDNVIEFVQDLASGTVRT